MKLLARFILLVASNAIALFAADYFIEGVSFPTTPLVFIEVIAIFTLLNFFLKPIIKAVLSPLIVLTLGVGIIVINALMLYILDWALDTVTIAGLYPLVYATLIIGVINTIIHFSARKLHKS